ncbi:TrkA C-terminal domain-containing protein [Spirilliplanes yamanashiensis]|uniref:RCK C-terminal domain-containing protein n=1 Tax=Spirilliplanes yamanashiensis TaxID=42233 RepID=A0A8J4DLJ6_9ACTN|nr:TrkA C-terminal domain-containing protein [Spirilliplanes yamanashiensis]MDP9819003.1 TrkA domain protein [Spirilliplanes yamanashiensis]GIJ05458.1 hypothetical protein Sya03_48100 [Spirilliplanes yamanashiensis]
MELERSVLPGLGVVQRFGTAHGQTVGVVSHLSGRREVVIYHPDDGDAVLHTVVLERDEAHAAADLLCAEVTREHVADLERQVPGMAVVRVRVPAGSPYDGLPLPDPLPPEVSVIAVVRDGRVIPAPAADLALDRDDEVVAAGTTAGTAALGALLTMS